MNPSLIFIFPALSIPFFIKRLVEPEERGILREAGEENGWMGRLTPCKRKELNLPIGALRPV
jgi:hypothetical protein